MNTFSLLKSKKGLSLIEVMIVVGIMSLVGLGVTSLLTNVAKVQRKGSVKSELQVVVQNVKANLLDDDSWVQTINAYPLGSPKLIDCLRDDVDPANYCVSGTSVSDITLRDPAGNVFYDGETPTAGFQESGAPCNTFDPLPGPGNDDCPFRYDVTVEMTCASGGTCQKPKVELVASLQVNPASKGQSKFNINTNNYDFDLNRSEEVKYEPLQVRHWQDATTAMAANAAGGECNYSGWQTRVLNDEVYDQGDNVALLGGNSFQLQPGSYECEVSAQSFHQPLGYRVQMRMTTAPAQTFFIGSGVTAPNAPSSMTGNANFTITAPTTFVIEHYCPASPIAADPNNFNSAPQSAFHMGLPMPDYSEGSSFTKVECVRSS